jgi:hypothetical protein
MSKKKKLGNGWYETADKKSGQTYYLHKDKLTHEEFQGDYIVIILYYHL